MANINYIPYAQQQAEIDRQRKYAQLLQQQASEPLESQQVSGIVVPTSPWLGLTKALQMGLGGYMEGKAAKRAADLDQQQREEANKQIQDFVSKVGPQKSYTSTPAMEQDFGKAETPEDYQNMMNNPQLNATPKMQFNDITGQNEAVQDWKTTLTPGMSRNEALAKMLEMQQSGNKYTAAMAPSMSAFLPAKPEIGAVNPADWTPESLAKYQESGNYQDLLPKTVAPKVSYENKELEFSDAKGNKMAQRFNFDSSSGRMVPVGEPYLKERASEGSWSQPVAMVDQEGQPVTMQYNSKGGSRVVSGLSVPSATGAGGRESTYTGRTITAGNQAVKTIQNIAELPSGASSGWLGSTTGHSLLDTTVGGLKNMMSDKDVKDYNIMVAGLERNLAAIETNGLLPSGTLTKQMGAVVFQPGDTEDVKLRRMAEARQIVTEGLSPLLENPRIPASQKAEIKQIIERTEKAVPYTHHDLTMFEMSNNPKLTIGDLTKGKGFGQTSTATSVTPSFQIVGVRKTP